MLQYSVRKFINFNSGHERYVMGKEFNCKRPSGRQQSLHTFQCKVFRALYIHQNKVKFHLAKELIEGNASYLCHFRVVVIVITLILNWYSLCPTTVSSVH